MISRHFFLIWILSAGLLVGTAEAVTCGANTPTPSNPDAAYTDNGDGTVTHKPTNLTWKRCVQGQSWIDSTCSAFPEKYTWAEALTLAATHSYAGKSDWRLPNLKELRSLVEECRNSPSINDTIFPAAPTRFFWTSSTSASDSYSAWHIGFDSGTDGQDAKFVQYAVRLVRGGSYVLGVSNSGTGYGNVASSPSGISCYLPQPGINYLVAPDCSENYASGTSVTLTATPATGNSFTGWSGACSGTGTCTVSMTAARSVAATFAQSVTAPVCTLNANPASIAAGASSTLTASCSPAATSYTWTGGTCASTTGVACTVTPTTTTTYTVAGTNAGGAGTAASAAVTVTPVSTYALGVSNSGTGYGNVASSPSGISCYLPQPGINYLVAPDCSENYASGTSVTLTATPATGNSFTGWSGACSGTGTCTVSMTAARSVAATFAQSVTAPVCTLNANPASIAAGASSTLTASCSPAAISYIWTGGTCAGSGSTCTVSPTVTTTYTVQGANAGGTNQAASTTVNVEPNRPPVCTLTANPTIVSAGGSSTLMATCTPTASSYTWTGGACAGTTGSICMVNPTVTTTYTVKGSNASGTGAAASAMVSVTVPNTCDVAPVSRPAGLTVTGTASNESFSNSAGNDRIDGAGGVDTVIYRCNRAYYTIVQTTTGWTVQSNAEGLDTLLNIERLQFADGTLALDVDGIAGQAYRIYQAAFNRTPDSGGLKYWIEQMDKGMDLQEVAARFVDSNEFRSLYGTNPTNASFLTKLYNNVLHRQPEQSGYDWWLDELNSGRRTQTKALADFSESDENKAGVLPAIKNGIELPN